MNRAVLVGRLTKDPELMTTTNGVYVCKFTVACDRQYTQNGERQSDFIQCIAWRQQAEFISKYFKKGHRIALDGSIQTRTWNDQNGNKRYATEVVVDHAEFAQSKSDNAASQTGIIVESTREQTPSNDFDTFMPISDDDLPF